MILEGIVYLAAVAPASTGKTKLLFIIRNSAHHRAVCVSFCLLPITDNISSSSRSLTLAAAGAAEQQYQKPQPHDINRQKKRARNANQLGYSASLLVPARLSHASRALLPIIGKIAAKTSNGN